MGAKNNNVWDLVGIKKKYFWIVILIANIFFSDEISIPTVQYILDCSRDICLDVTPVNIKL